MTLLEKALQLALRAHKEQVRKTDDTPYAAHPIMVAWVLSQHGFADEIVAAALVHDVVEDTDYTLADIERELGTDIARIVKAVTEDKSLPYKERKRGYVESVRDGGKEAWAVSLGDKIHNMQSLINSYAILGPVLWGKFSRGKEEKLKFEKDMLAMLRSVWEHPLIDEYAALIGKADMLAV